METTKKQKKHFEVPGTYVILTALIVLMILLTYILPAGTYDFAEDGKTVIPGTYHHVESNPAGIMDFFNCFFKGMSKGSGTIFLIFMIGGAFKMLEDTGTIKAAIAWLIKKTKGNYKIILPAIGIMMAALGSVGAGNNIALAFAPIMIMVCKKLKLDPIVAVAAMYIPSSTGTVSSPIEPFNTLIGQEIAGLPQMSGAGVRLIAWIIFVAVAIGYIVRYANRISKDPSKSIVGCYSDDEEIGDQDAALAGVADKLTVRHVLCLIVLLAVFVVYAYGTIKYTWGISQLGACMMILAFASGIIGGMTPDQMEKSFAAGAKTMTYSALLVGFANALSVIMTDANIMHTVINAISIPLGALPAALSAVGMFIVNLLMNIFISSSSGQAYVIMPLMAPLADVVGVTRQVAVSAYCFGEAIGNPLFPTAALIMGICGIAGVKYDKWLKFVVPLTGILCGLAIVFLVVTQTLGWC
ncbi:MAG: SLC13 family permease [Clostridiales bacterium]|nr:SLC13 family permease [Clostridiales bacterium]